MSQMFSQVTLCLLSGRMIDRVTEPAMMNWLQDEQNLVEVQAYLAKINRQVLMTSDKEGAYLGYIDINERASNRAVRQSFAQMSVSLYPLILWLRLVRGATDSSRPLQVGDVIKLSDLMASIESSKQLELQLADIINKIGRQTKEARKQLMSLVDYLENEGYLYSVSSTGALYKATAKWSLLYDQLDYIGKYQHVAQRAEEVAYADESRRYQDSFDLAVGDDNDDSANNGNNDSVKDSNDDSTEATGRIAQANKADNTDAGNTDIASISHAIDNTGNHQDEAQHGSS